ncbi:uncharacterized protein BT62DRAFT_935738 [Guyanagaster necrorhizus]|uniref:Uncharacterized protein n=1 Tax=Guyanagaster necrorhizus TaxID=856835 RepID=A0A9P7VMK5_9AGAR|nr:uncharacterized protein BT62DRAFT_935738 [Guyanagaster necrorhizus MCA 3950]KAG7442706.1 hypothetical protein BT62DRAFT_935738 [Guyanagaster necrorhizus MCA 3950]
MESYYNDIVMYLLTGFILLVLLPLQIAGQTTTDPMATVSLSVPSGVIPSFSSSVNSSISSVATPTTSTSTSAGFENSVSGGMVIAGLGVGLMAMAA